MRWVDFTLERPQVSQVYFCKFKYHVDPTRKHQWSKWAWHAFQRERRQILYIPAKGELDDHMYSYYQGQTPPVFIVKELNGNLPLSGFPVTKQDGKLLCLQVVGDDYEHTTMRPPQDVLRYFHWLDDPTQDMALGPKFLNRAAKLMDEIQDILPPTCGL